MPRPDFIRFGREICGNLAEAERREWWLADGLGGYAAGTVAGTLTRRYHGLLVVPLSPNLGRSLVFAKADAWLELDGETWPLCSNRWPDGVVDPGGHTHIESFRLDGRLPEWSYAFGDFRLKFRLWLEPGAHTLYLAYRPDWPDSRLRDARLRIRLLANARDHHGNTEPWHFNPVVEPDGAEGLLVRNPQGSGSAPYQLRFRAHGGAFRTDHTWYENFDLPAERARGLPFRDRHLCVGECGLPLANGEWSGLTASLDPEASPYVEESLRRFQAHDDGLLTRTEVAVPALRDAPAWIRQLVLAADSFLFARPLPGRPDGVSVIAGYPWFADWGRDTMIALPGLTLAAGRYDEARGILETYARFVDGGMLPNVFPEDGDHPEYNTVDAALWYIEAWRAYVEATDDLPALREVVPVLEEIIAHYRRGTRFGIGLDESDGLIRCGQPGVQLTWMDAKVGDWVVTPRMGKPVEINALWFNALQTMAEFSRRLKRPAAEFEMLAELARAGFRRFLDPETGGLLDVLDGPEGDDSTLRPNQILAVSLPYSPLSDEERIGVLRVCGRSLLTSYGLRSLTPGHPDYRPRYGGDVLERDGAYHQGTAWTWLLGHYALAEFRATGDAGRALGLLEPIRDHLLDAGLGTISEIFDADPPHGPQGCPAQAWSVATVLEAWWRISRARPI